jgi:hypothetical protein
MADREVAEFNRELERINWDSTNSEAIDEARELFEGKGAIVLRKITLKAIQEIWDSEDGEGAYKSGDSTGRIRLTGTHIKFLLGTAASSHVDREGYQWWGHEWMPKAERPFADRPHFHRSDMTAMITGDTPYDMSLWRCPDPEMPTSETWLPTAEQWAHPLVHRFKTGEAWRMNTHDIHKIQILSAGTSSTIVQGPRILDASAIFDEQTGGLQRTFPDMLCQFELMKQELADLSGSPK